MRPLPSLALLLLAACKQPDDTALEDLPFLGADPSVPATSGEARAGVIRDGEAGEAALFGGISAEGRAGDIKIYNAAVQFVIQGPYMSHGYVPVGGGIIDADRVRPDHQLGRDLVEDVYLAFSMSRLFHADTVRVIADGSDGGDAIVQATGTDVPWAWFQGMFERDEPVVDELGLEITTTYTLPPDSDTLGISTRFTNPGDETIELSPQEGAWGSGEDFIPWEYGTGYAELDSDRRSWLILTGRQGEATLSLWRDQDDYGTGVITSLAAEYGMVLADLGALELAAGESAEVDRNLTLGADPMSALAGRPEFAGEPMGELCAGVAAGGDLVAGARVHFVSDDGLVGWAITDSVGFSCSDLPAGTTTAYAVGHADLEHVQLPGGRGRYAPLGAASVNEPVLELYRSEIEAQAPPWATGHAASEGLEVELSEGSTAIIALELGQPGQLEVRLEDQDGAPLPGVLELLWSEGAPPESAVPAELRELMGIPTGSRAGWAWTADGTLTIDALPGTYDLVAVHDWRHEQASATEVELLAGETTQLTLVLERVIEPDGWLALDAHLHGAPSFDGALPMADRLLACAATGVDIAAITDHDVHVDYEPLLEAMGLRDRLLTLPGVEVTTMMRGHFNLWPIVPAAREVPNAGALDWWNLRVSTDELMGLMREAVGPDALVQVNHPRTPGMLTFANYDPTTGEVDDPDKFSWDFEVFELINGGVTDLEQVRLDFFGFLNQGYVRTPLGVSDSHYRFIPCGMGRTDLYLDADTPGSLHGQEVVDAVLAGHAVAATGTTLRASAGDALPGDTITGGSASLEVQVLAPSWIQPGTLRLIRNGETVFEHALTEADDGVWYESTLTIEAEADAWFVVEVVGTVPMGAAWRNATPYAMSNAFFLDVDGDGWQAPGI
jgi:hypothetical protein